MQFDFSALDAELDGLASGGPPEGRFPAEDALTLAQRYAPPELAHSTGRPLPLDQIDRALAALESDGAPLPPVTIEREPLPFAPSFATPPALVDAPAEFPSTPPAALAAPAALPGQPPAALAAVAFPSEPPPFEANEFPSAPPAAFEPPAQLHSEPPPRLQSEPPTLPDPVEPFEHAPARTNTSATLTQSQEIVLPDPVRDEPALESGELRLDGDEPSSGSFELPESATEPRITSSDREPAPASNALEPFDEVQDALEGSQPIMLSAPPARAGSSFQDRDPDAEFDALLSEATDPRGIPTGARAGTSGEVDTDDLLRGLEGDDLADEEVSAEELAAAHADEPHEADVLTRSLFDDAGESTEITDRSALVGALAAAKVAKVADADVTLADDELDADDLEIVMDDDDGATLAPPAGPQSSKAPPPPPPAADKRPSLLGRLFNKREPGSSE